MTEEQIKEVITKSLEAEVDRLIEEHLIQIKKQLVSSSHHKILEVMEECQVRIVQDNDTFQTNIQIYFGK